MKKLNELYKQDKLIEFINRIKSIWDNLCNVATKLMDIEYEEVDRHDPVLSIRPHKNRLADMRLNITRCRNNC